MKVVIDLSDHSYNNIMAVTSMSLGRYPYKGIVMAAINAIKNGTIIPEGHGALLDDIQLKQEFEDFYNEHRKMGITMCYADIDTVISLTPAVIKAE